MQSKLPTISDVARRSGFSNATISRYLNGMESVSSEAQAAIAQAIIELGYVPSANARGLATQTSSMFGLCVPQSWAQSSWAQSLLNLPLESSLRIDEQPQISAGRCDSSITEVIRGVERAAWDAQRAITITVADDFQFTERISDLITRVDGLIIVADALPALVVTQVAQRIPVVMINGSTHPRVHDYIDCDTAAAMQLLAEHVVTGHTPSTVILVSAPDFTIANREKKRGVEKALPQVVLDGFNSQQPELITLEAHSTVVAGEELAETFRERIRNGELGELPAFLCASDDVAVGLVAGLQKAGISIPTQAIVTGFDECRVAASTSPRLTTVKTPTAHLGILAIEALLKRIAEPGAPENFVRAGAQVVVRDSCGAHTPESD